MTTEKALAQYLVVTARLRSILKRERSLLGQSDLTVSSTIVPPPERRLDVYV